jgi:hypothetical protein
MNTLVDFLKDPHWSVITLFGILLGAFIDWVIKLIRFIFRKLRSSHYLEKEWHAYYVTRYEGKCEIGKQIWEIKRGFFVDLKVFIRNSPGDPPICTGSIREEHGKVLAFLDVEGQTSSFAVRLRRAFAGKEMRLYGLWIGENYDDRVTSACFILCEDQLEDEDIKRYMEKIEVYPEDRLLCVG